MKHDNFIALIIMDHKQNVDSMTYRESHVEYFGIKGCHF